MAGRLDFSKRSAQKELLDRDDIPFRDIERNMQELDVINTWLGGHSISVEGLRQLCGDGKRISLCEIGCGGGDNLRVLSRWCRKRGMDVRVMGIDKSAHCIAVAREKWTEGPAEWVHLDYREVVFADERPDIIYSSLFCHHFTDEELVGQLQWMEGNAGMGWFINDLQRHPLAYYAIRLLTAGFSTSYLVKHDAPISVLRGFSREEWKRLLRLSAAETASVSWKWAFRWLVVRRKQHV